MYSQSSKGVVLISVLQSSAIKMWFPLASQLQIIFFELFLSSSVDNALMDWQHQHRGIATRYSDNILVTWRKNNIKEFESLKNIFNHFAVRFTPQVPRKWEEPINFCGITIPRKGKPHLSNERKRQIRTASKSIKSIHGADIFIREWSWSRKNRILAAKKSTGLRGFPGRWSFSAQRNWIFSVSSQPIDLAGDRPISSRDNRVWIFWWRQGELRDSVLILYGLNLLHVPCYDLPSNCSFIFSYAPKVYPGAFCFICKLRYNS